MDFFAFSPVAAVLDLAYAGLMALAALLTPVAGTSAAAAAVVLVTVLVRTVLIPVGVTQAKAEQTRARLAPRIRELQRRFRRQPERLQRETMKLYRDEHASPFAGCVPVALQAPVVGVLYAVFLRPTIAGHPNILLDETVAGVPLGASLFGSLTAGAIDGASAVLCGALVAAIALTSEVTRRLFRMPHAPRASDAPAPALLGGVLGMLQFITAVVAIFVPLAAGLYLLVTVVWTLGQRLILRRVYPTVVT